jgi:hypothetical protein
MGVACRRSLGRNAVSFSAHTNLGMLIQRRIECLTYIRIAALIVLSSAVITLATPFIPAAAPMARLHRQCQPARAVVARIVVGAKSAGSIFRFRAHKARWHRPIPRGAHDNPESETICWSTGELCAIPWTRIRVSGQSGERDLGGSFGNRGEVCSFTFEGYVVVRV